MSRVLAQPDFRVVVLVLVALVMGCSTPAAAGFQEVSKWEEATCRPLKIPLRVHNPTDLPRRLEPVTSGIPLASDCNIWSVEQLRLTDAQGIAVPAQFRILSRWGRLEDPRAPIRWVLVDLQAEVDPRATNVYRLEEGSTPPASAGISVSDTHTAVEVTTGTARVRIPKQGRGFLDQIWYDGRPLLSSPANLRVEREGGSFFSVVDPSAGVLIEESGRLRTVIRVRGLFENQHGNFWVGGDARPEMKKGRPAPELQPLTFEVRLAFYAGGQFVKLEVTLKNDGNSLVTYYPVNDTFFDGFYVDIPWKVGDPAQVSFPEHHQKAGLKGRWLLTQTHSVKDPADEGFNFLRQLKQFESEERLLKEGRRGEGWAVLCDQAHCYGLGLMNFWQNYPKSLEVSSKGTVLGLWPAGLGPGEVGPYGKGNYYFSGGWHKTHELHLAFWKAGERDPAEMKGFLQPSLFALAPSAWYASSRAWSLIAPAGFKAMNSTTRDAIERYERFRAILIDPFASDDGVTLEHLRETRGLATTRWPGFHFDLDLYGWEAFGEIPWGGNRAGLYSALHYDWAYAMWLHLIRSGDLRYLSYALEMTNHSSDLDQIHNVPTMNPNMLDGIWWWEQLRDGKNHHRSTQAAGLIISHTWNGGYALGYLLTGNPRYKEAAIAGALAGRRYWFGLHDVSNRKVVFDQTRSQAWSILMLVNLYRIDGDIAHLKDALTIFANSLLHTEQLSDPPGSAGKGYIAIGQYSDKSYIGKAVVTFVTYPLEPLSELHYEARVAGLEVQELETYLIRSLDWLKDYAYLGGLTATTGQYSALTLSYATDPNDQSKNKGGTYQHNVHVASGFAYGYLMLKDKDLQKAAEYLDFARRLFRDLILYRETGDLSPEKFFEPQKRGPIRLGWPGTFTKELGWISRSGQFYLHAEYLLVGEAERQK